MKQIKSTRLIIFRNKFKNARHVSTKLSTYKKSRSKPLQFKKQPLQA